MSFSILGIYLVHAPTTPTTEKQVLKRISGDFSPEADFAARQITKEDFPGRYPYRDYGLKYWDATHTWVKEYLDVSLLAGGCSVFSRSSS